MRTIVGLLTLCMMVFGVASLAAAERPKLDVQGGGSLVFRLGSVSGAGGEEAYSSQYWDTSGFDHQAQVNVSGFLVDHVFVQGRVASGRFSRATTDLSVRFDTSGSNVTVGTVSADLGSNPFISFRRQLNGVAAKGKTDDGRYGYSCFVSRSKGARRTESFPGNDTPGPYLLRYTPVSDGSEVVKVDEQPKRRGVDYVIDYYSGVLTFEVGFGAESSTTVIPSTSTISVSYEQARGGSNEGTLYGVDAKARATSRLSLDMAYVARIPQYQPAPQQNSIQRTEEFFGAGSPGPFWLSYRPLDQTQPMAVYLDGNLMQQDLDYHFDVAEMAIEFFTSVSPLSMVRVEYYQFQEATAASDALKVVGLSGSLAADDNTNLRLDYAKSVRGGVISGSAVGLHADSKLMDGKTNLSGNFRTLSPSFSRVEGLGFDTQSTGYDLACDVKASDFVSISASYGRDRSNSGLNFGYGGYGSTSGYSAGVSGASSDSSYAIGTGKSFLGVSLNFPNLPRMSLQRSVMSNSSGGGASAMTSNSLAMSYARGQFSTSAKFSLGGQSLSSVADTGDGSAAAFATAFKSSARNLSFSWIPNHRLNLTTSLSSNASQGGSGGTSADSLDFGLTHYITDALTLTVRRSLSTSRGTVYSYLSPSDSIGTTGGYYSPPVMAASRQAVDIASVAVYRNVFSAYGLTYASGSDFSASVLVNDRSYLDAGDSYASSRGSRDATLSLNKALGRFMRASVNVATQQSSYGGDMGGDVRGRDLGLNFTYQPRSGGEFLLGYRRDSYSSAGLGGQQGVVTTGNSSLTGQYRCSLPHGNSLSSSLNLTNGQGGYANYRRLVWNTEYAIPINDLFSASLNLTHRQNKALGQQDLVGSSSGDYSAFSFSAQLTARFQ
jgi:hypothetical protein